MSNVIIGGSAAGATALPVVSTIDATQDYIPIYTASATATQAINRNTFLGLASVPVGLTDTQTLTNKTLTSPTISGPTFSGTLIGTYTIGGTPTFPAAVVQLTTTQTLTNKVLTSPTINAPTITNATISADTLTGFTVSNNGTIYGVSVTGGTIGNAGLAASSVNTSQIASGIQLVDKMKIPYNFYCYRTAALTSAGANTLVPFDTKTAPGYDTGSNVDVVTNKGRFTAPITGFYIFMATAGNSTAGGGGCVFLYVNGVQALTGVDTLGDTVVGKFSQVTGKLKLNASDYVEVYYVGGSGSTMVVGASNCWFQGHLLSAS